MPEIITIKPATRAEEICDFCTLAQTEWVYPAHDFCISDEDGIQTNSIGAWGACNLCHADLVAGNYEWLADRYLRQFRFIPMSAYAEIKAKVVKLHGTFLKNRAGEASKRESKGNA